MHFLKAAISITVLVFTTPAFAEDHLLTPEGIKDHLWEFEDIDAIAADLESRRPQVRAFTHKDTKTDGGLAIGLIKAPIGKTLEVVRDYGKYKDLLPFFKESILLGSGGNRALVHIKIEIVKGLVTRWGNLEFIESEADRNTSVINCRMTKGNMKFFLARFELVPVGDDRTLIMVRLLIDPAMDIAAQAKVDRYNVVNARRFIRHIRDKATTP